LCIKNENAGDVKHILHYNGFCGRKGCNFHQMHSGELVSIEVKAFHVMKTYSGLDVTKVKCNVSEDLQ
jgi:hypothetical protein